MCVSTVAPAPGKKPVMDISHYVNFVETGILIAFPTEKGRAWVDSSVFDKHVIRGPKVFVIRFPQRTLIKNLF